MPIARQMPPPDSFPSATPLEGPPLGATAGEPGRPDANDLGVVFPVPGAPVPVSAPTFLAAGGGNLNGSQNTAHMIGQAGTAGTKIALPRQVKAGNNGSLGVT